MTVRRKSDKSLWLMLALIAAILALILLLPGCGGRQRSDAQAATLVKAGETAPDFTVELFDGSRVTLSDLRGKVVLLNFWATWCPPCREELQRVQREVIDRFAGRDFVFLPVSRGESREAVRKFRAQSGHAFPMGLDSTQSVYNLYASQFIPRNFLIDKQGRVVLATTGYDSEEFEALLEQIENTLE